MSIAMGVVALSLLGAGSEKPIGPEWISYTVRTVEMPATGWFWGHSNALKLVGRQGTCEIWTSSRATADALVSQTGAEVKSTLSDSKPQGCQSVVGAHTTRNFVTGLSPVVGQGRVEIVPQTETVLDGCSTSITAQESTGGIRARVDCTSNWLVDIREVGAQSSSVGGFRAGTVQLPRLVTCEVKGEWTIPDDGVLLISLGTTLSGTKATELIERVAIIEAHKVPAPTPYILPASYHPDLGNIRPIAALSVRPMPALPDRSLLPAIGPDGKPVTLPTPPDTQVSTASFVGPPIARPSPQTNTPVTAYIVNPVFNPQAQHGPITVGPSNLGLEGAKMASTPIRKSSMKFDPSVAQAKYEPIPIGPSSLVIDGAKLATGRPQSLHIPLTDRLAIDVDIKIVPATRGE